MIDEPVIDNVSEETPDEGFQLPDPLVQLDLTHYKGRICEMSLVRWDGDQKTDYWTLINPGISLEGSDLPMGDGDVVTKPRFEDVAPALWPVLRGAHVLGTWSHLSVFLAEAKRVRLDLWECRDA